VKKGQLSHLGNVEDDPVVHDKASGHYFMFYWDRKHEPNGLFRAESPNETDFDFEHPEPIHIEGLKYPAMYKFAHVFQDGGLWYMFFGEFVRPGAKTAIPVMRLQAMASTGPRKTPTFSSDRMVKS
jgi:hypothetical protein